MSFYLPARVHDTSLGCELELYEAPVVTGQYRLYDDSADAARVLTAGATAAGWAVVRVEEIEQP